MAYIHNILPRLSTLMAYAFHDLHVTSKLVKRKDAWYSSAEINQTYLKQINQVYIN